MVVAIALVLLGAGCTGDGVEREGVEPDGVETDRRMPDDRLLDAPLGRDQALLPERVGELVPPGTWLLAEVRIDDVPVPPFPRSRTLVTVRNNRLAVATCSWIPSSLDLEEIGLPELPTSLLLACGGSGDRADVVIEALEQVDEIESSDGGHVLTGPDVVVQLDALVPVPEAVFDRTWTLVDWLPTLRHELVPAVAPSTLLLHADGRFEGTSGCGEEISGIWERQDDGLRMPIFDITAPCDDPDPALVDQHGWVTMQGVGIRPVLTDDGRMLVVMGVGANDRVSLVYE